MLSLSKCASGTNLVEAHHIIFVDLQSSSFIDCFNVSNLEPVTGTKAKAQAIESQTIGRTYRQGQSHQVTIMRFLIKDTIEHKMYITNYVQGEAGQQSIEGTLLNVMSTHFPF
jgi:hypothetical protein